MPNEKGWLTRAEAEATGKPLWIQQDSRDPGRWTHEYPYHAVLMTKTRCKQLKMPVFRNEPPAAYKYANAENSSYRYVPLYDRTDVFEAGELPYSILLPGEQMGEPGKGSEEDEENGAN